MIHNTVSQMIQKSNGPTRLPIILIQFILISSLLKYVDITQSFQYIKIFTTKFLIGVSVVCLCGYGNLILLSRKNKTKQNKTKKQFRQPYRRKLPLRIHFRPSSPLPSLYSTSLEKNLKEYKNCITYHQNIIFAWDNVFS